MLIFACRSFIINNIVVNINSKKIVELSRKFTTRVTLILLNGSNLNNRRNKNAFTNWH